MFGAVMKSFSLWLVLAVATIAVGIVVPYSLLAGGTAPDVFIFWCIFGIAVIALIAAGTAGWRD